MSTPTAGNAILRLCSRVEERICGTLDCQHMGQSCEAPGCDNSICRLHGHYCPRCEQRYCEDCHAAHLEACYGAETDAYDELVERESDPAAEAK